MHEDVLGLPLPLALQVLAEREVQDIEIVWTCAPRAPQPEGTARVVALRQEGRVVVAARFLDGIVQV